VLPEVFAAMKEPDSEFKTASIMQTKRKGLAMVMRCKKHQAIKFVLCIAGVLALLIGLIVTAIVIIEWARLRPSPTYRFSIPPGTALTEQIAIEFSRKALIADGKGSPGILPTPYRSQGPGEDGRNLYYFAVNTIDPDNGSVLWTTREGSCSVDVHKRGNQIECRVSLLK
jgi:hypothetical protein